MVLRVLIAAAGSPLTDDPVSYSFGDLLRRNLVTADPGEPDEEAVSDPASGSAATQGSAGSARPALRLVDGAAVPTSAPVDAGERAPVLARRDGVTRVSASAALDGQNRVAVKRVLASLGWEAGVPLVARIDRALGTPRVVVTPGAPMCLLDHPVTLDRAGRFRLPPQVAGALEVSPGDDVRAVALPGCDLVVLLADADTLAALTHGYTPPVPEPADAAEPLAAGERQSQVRRPAALPALPG